VDATRTPLGVPTLEADLAKAETLASRWYLDPAALELERDRIFARTWQFAGPLAQVAKSGDYFTADVAGEPVLVTRDGEGRLRAFFNVCRHRAGAVAQGRGNCKMFRCAYHGWTYGLDGALRQTPEFAGVERFDKASYGLREIDVDTFGPFAFVRLERGGPSLHETLGKIPAETAALPLANMAFYKRHVYELDCNWKVYVDNYLEGYHIPVAHPGLFKEIDYRAYRVECERWYSKQHAPIRARGESLYKRNIDAGALPQALYYWVFPNMMWNFYPDNLQINLIVPLGPTRTATIFDWFLLEPDRPGAAEDFAASFAFSDQVQQEDIQICTQVQRGLGSRSYRAGRYSVEREGGVHHFHGLYAELMRATPGPAAPSTPRPS
jgi:choline monooxygenase